MPTSRPSTAESTEIAGREHGVAVEERRAEHADQRAASTASRGRSRTDAVASASSAMMPPSPRLSARSTSVTYLSETTIISAQKIADMPPRMFSGVSANAVLGIEGFLRRVERARADIAVDDAQGEQRKPSVARRGARLLASVRPPWPRARSHSLRGKHGAVAESPGARRPEFYCTNALIERYERLRPILHSQAIRRIGVERSSNVTRVRSR